MKAYLAVPIKLGATLPRGVMSDDGEALYVHPGALKRQGSIQAEDCHRITHEFYELTKKRFGLRVGDVIVNRSGEGTIGKSAIFELDEPSVFADFTMRLRFDASMNPEFASYYFRSTMFQPQIEREKRGMGNMTNIFPSQVQNMCVVDCPRAQQDDIATQISSALSALQHERDTIEARRKEIDALIEDALTRL